MRRVAFLIPASPTPAFFSQIAAFVAAMHAAPWTRWTPEARVYFGGAGEADAVARWWARMGEVERVFLADRRVEQHGYFAQGDARLRHPPEDADVVVLCDADILIVGSVEDALDAVFETGGIGGVQAHFPVPDPVAASSRELWGRLSDGLSPMPVLDQTHSLMNEAELPERREAPFYVNFGFVALARAALSRFAPAYFELREAVGSRLQVPYFSAQVALTLAVAREDMPVTPLSLAYNFPNDATADQMYPDALADVRVFHYLRTAEIQRDAIFASAEGYRQFLEADLAGSNQVFRSHVLRIFGSAYPFT